MVNKTIQKAPPGNSEKTHLPGSTTPGRKLPKQTWREKNAVWKYQGHSSYLNQPISVVKQEVTFEDLGYNILTHPSMVDLTLDFSPSPIKKANTAHLASTFEDLYSLARFFEDVSFCNSKENCLILLGKTIMTIKLNCKVELQPSWSNRQCY